MTENLLLNLGSWILDLVHFSSPLSDDCNVILFNSGVKNKY